MSEQMQEVGERGVIRRLAALLPGREDIRVGVGDDTAVVAGGDGMDLLLTSDGVGEGRHFEPGEDPVAVGHKAVARVLSDLAAMGGEPQWALIDLVAPGTLPVESLDALYAGATRVADAFGLAIVGGDTAEGDRLALHVFGVGRVPAGSAILRSGAENGQVLYVTGSLGGSRAGKHLHFSPRVAEGRWLREQGFARAMIDVSDGLATDAGHLAKSSRVGCVLVSHEIPLSAEATTVEQALYDGEDFELLFTVDAHQREAFETAWAEQFDLPCTAVGAITEDPGVVYLIDASDRARRISDAGYEHFRE